MGLLKKEQEAIKKHLQASIKFQNEGDIVGYELALAMVDIINEEAEVRAKAKADAEDQAWWAECEHRQNVKLGIHDDYLERSDY
jgi:hypothetical protein